MTNRATAFEIAERINQAVGLMAETARQAGIPITDAQCRAVYARCIQREERKWLGQQHTTLNATRTIENLKRLAPPELVSRTETAVRYAMSLLYATDQEPGYTLSPQQITDLHHPDAAIYRDRIRQRLSQAPEMSLQRQRHHRRFLDRLDNREPQAAQEEHRLISALPWREAIPGTATGQLAQAIIDLLAPEQVHVTERQARELYDLANNPSPIAANRNHPRSHRQCRQN